MEYENFLEMQRDDDENNESNNMNVEQHDYDDNAPLTPPHQNTNDAKGTAKGCAWRLPAQPETGSKASEQPFDDNAPLTPPR